jgi:hypothetical protein
MALRIPPNASPARYVSLKTLLRLGEAEAEGRLSVLRYRLRRAFPETARRLTVAALPPRQTLPK